jgi:tripartite-type tricarboxylate transporter receptor subunit TctC
MELLQSLTGMDILHVPYKGAVPAVIATAGGEVELAFSSIAAALPLIKAKRMNALAVTSTKRLASLPEAPTVAESGIPAFDVTPNYGVLAAAGTPASVVKLLNAEIRAIVRMDDVQSKFALQGLEAMGSTPDEYKAIMKAETARWARVVKDAQIPPN